MVAVLVTANGIEMATVPRTDSNLQQHQRLLNLPRHAVVARPVVDIMPIKRQLELELQSMVSAIIVHQQLAGIIFLTWT
eukprot:9481523-Pyramimonas_sp.AAC.1